MNQPASAYFLNNDSPREQRATLSIVVDNEVGALARVVGLFAARGYNIESLTVAETDHLKHTSRITIVTRATLIMIEQIKAQLGRLIPVHRVIELGVDRPGVEREMALIKCVGEGERRAEALRLSKVFRARVVDITHDSFTFEVTGSPVKIEAFIELMIPLGLVELSRTGIVAISRGHEPL
ncbi:MAG: acetolactate synthase small subunit [Lysobacterales bacterium]